MSMMSRKKTVQFNELSQNYGSDSNIHRSSNHEFIRRIPNPTNVANLQPSNPGCSCQKAQTIPQIKIEDTEATESCSNNCQNAIQHRLVARLRQACSLADLQNTNVQTCQLSKSLNSLGDWYVLDANYFLKIIFYAFHDLTIIMYKSMKRFWPYNKTMRYQKLLNP